MRLHHRPRVREEHLVLPSGRTIDVLAPLPDPREKLRDAAELTREAYAEHEAAPIGSYERKLAWLSYQGALVCEAYWHAKAASWS